MGDNRCSIHDTSFCNCIKLEDGTIVNKIKHDRKPIVLNKNNIALLMIYHKSDDILDVSIGAMDRFMSHEDTYESAREFLRQFNGSVSRRFIRALRDECDNWLKEKEYGNRK